MPLPHLFFFLNFVQSFFLSPALNKTSACHRFTQPRFRLLPDTKMEGTLTESDNLNETCRRIGQTERKHDRVQRQEDEKELGSRAEPFDDDYSEAFGWRKTPDRM